MTEGALRLLYIARAFPPTLGGMETFAYRLSEAMRRQADVTLLVNRGGKKALPAFLLYAIGSAALLARRRRADAIHLADALLAPAGAALKQLTGLPVTASVCGLDITFPNRLYQSVVPGSLARLDMTMPISKATEAEVHARAGRGTPTEVIPLGVNPLPEPDAAALREFRRRAELAGHERLLLTTGRLIRRKGVRWFVRDVLPRLPSDTVYVVVGEGKEELAIRTTALEAGVLDRVRLLGRVPDGVLSAAYRSADVFVMPNVPVPGDMEGFGLVALEAASSGLPVVASRLEGITEAVHHGRNGLLVTPASAEEYVSLLVELLALSKTERQTMGAAFRDYTIETYGWDHVAQRYLEVVRNVAA